MKPARLWALTGAVALGLSMAAITGPPAAASPHPGPAAHRIALRGTLAPAKDRARRAGTVAGTSQVGFDLTLSLQNAPPRRLSCSRYRLPARRSSTTT